MARPAEIARPIGFRVPCGTAGVDTPKPSGTALGAGRSAVFHAVSAPSRGNGSVENTTSTATSK